MISFREDFRGLLRSGFGFQLGRALRSVSFTFMVFVWDIHAVVCEVFALAAILVEVSDFKFRCSDVYSSISVLIGAF